MNDQRYAQLLEELLDGIDHGDFNSTESVPDKYNFAHLEAIFYYADQLDGGRTLFRQLFDIICSIGRNAIQKKINQGDRIKVTFLTFSAAEWPADSLYHLLERNPIFDVSVTNVFLIDRDIEDSNRTYRQNKLFFESKEYRVLNTFDFVNNKVITWDELDETPDVVIHCSCWHESLPEFYRISSYPLSRVNFYIPYCFDTGNSINGKYVNQISYNKEFINMMNTVYLCSQKDIDGYAKYQLLGGSNALFSGYIKMDYFYDSKVYSEKEIRDLWKIPTENDCYKVKKIIIAPHHSFLGYGGIKFSTFANNAYFWLYLAEKYSDSISFIFKPHPNLRTRAIEAKVFQDYDEWNEYIRRWNNLPNAKVVEEQSYLEFFETSDAIIMDSISFIAEYLYTGKPGLFLTRREQAFTELGEICLNGYERIAGNDYIGIEEFVQNTVLGGNDKTSETRTAIFKDCLDYKRLNHCSASEFVYSDILQKLGIC